MGIDSESGAYVAIARVHDTYADIVTRRAWDELAGVFGPDATLTLGHGPRARVVVGPEAIGGLIEGAVAHLELVEFVVLNTVATISGDSARTRSNIWEMHLARDDGRRRDLFGVYHDRLQRIDGRWWFAERHWQGLARRGDDGDPYETYRFPVGFDDWLDR